MDAANHADDHAPEPVLYQANLKPYRSLNQRGFLIVMAIVAAISFVCGTAFLLMGAWPVFGLFGLDVLAIYVAFRMNFRSARAREEITVTPSLITIRQIDEKGVAQEAHMNPLWTRLHKELWRITASSASPCSRAGAPFRSAASCTPSSARNSPRGSGTR